jgi:hypothetical protein
MKRDYTAGELVDLERTARECDTYGGRWARAADALRQFCEEQRARVGPPVMAAPKPPRKRPARAGGGAS